MNTRRICMNDVYDLNLMGGNADKAHYAVYWWSNDGIFDRYSVNRMICEFTKDNRVYMIARTVDDKETLSMMQNNANIITDLQLCQIVNGSEYTKIILSMKNLKSVVFDNLRVFENKELINGLLKAKLTRFGFLKGSENIGLIKTFIDEGGVSEIVCNYESFDIIKKFDNFKKIKKAFIIADSTNEEKARCIKVDGLRIIILVFGNIDRKFFITEVEDFA